MTFLNPAILIGLLAASIPVIIHLLNLKKLKNVEFSTLMFLKELQKNKIRKIKIKQWLLLFLRVLIITFIVLSFARPTLQGISITGVTSAAKTTTVFLIDNTFSASVVDQQGSILNQAKKLTEKIISFHQEGDEIFISFFTDDSISELSLNSKDLLNSLKSNNISFLKADLKKKLISAAEIVNKSKNFNREIFIFTDLQKNLLPAEFEKDDLSELFNNRVKIYTALLSKKDIFNLSIDNLEPENQILQKGSNVKFIATITNHSMQNLQNRILSLFIDDKRVAQKSFNIDPDETQKIEIETTLYSDGLLNVFAEIESDDIEYDNRNYISINIPEKISVLILRDGITNPDFLTLALKTLPDNKIIFDIKDVNSTSSSNLNNYDVVILNSDSYANINQLKNYLEQGNSIIIIPTSNLNINSFNNLLNNLNLGRFDSYISTIDNVRTQFDKVDYDHPIFKDIFKNNQQRKFDSPIITQFMKSSSLGGTPIISLSDNSKFLSEHKIGRGKILLFNSAFDLNWNDLPLKSIFVPLIVKSVFYLSQKDFSSYQLKAGEEFILNINKINASRVIIERPDGTEDYFQLNEINSDVLKYNKTDLTGIYKIFSDDKLFTSFAVNHHSDESKQNFFNIDDFANFLESINFSGQQIQIDPNDNLVEQINQARFGSELWKIFVLLAIITAIVEMIISKNNRKEIQSLTEADIK